MKRYIGLTLLFLFTVMCTNSFAAQTPIQISVGSVNAVAGKSVSLDITVDAPGQIAGAAFTLTYDKNKLTLTSITSTFFDTFTNQWNSLSPVPNPLPPGSVTVDGTVYTQPLVKNSVSGGMSIAAARCKAGAASTTLFTVTFTVGASVTPGPISVNIIPTVLNNINAGYLAGGEAVPILIGALDDPNVLLKDAYPVLPSTIVPGAVTVGPPGVVDSDGDGIDDAWEMAHFGNLTTANATSDYDKDGWTDLEEFKNGTDPKIPNPKPGIETLAADFGGTNGLYFYSNENWINIIPMSPKEMIYFDIDNDGIKELVASFVGYGLCYFKADGWHVISSYVPKSMILFDNKLALDFETLGIFLYPGWDHLLDDFVADKMVAVDTNQDNLKELFVSFQAYGLFKYDQVTGWSFLTAAVPEKMISVGNGLVGDFGTQYGLYLYDQNGWHNLVPGLKPTALCGADINKDGKEEIIAGYDGYGLFSYNTTTSSWALLNYAAPEGVIPYLGGIVCDYGSAYGLFSYSQDTDWKQLVPLDPDKMISGHINTDNSADLVVVFPTYGTWMFDEVTQIWKQLSPFDIKQMACPK